MNEEIALGNELEITQKDMIVSSTDRKGTIIYANDVFCDIAGYTRDEVIGQPHNMIRHPDMPRAVFKLLWDRVLSGKIIYAFVKNKAKNGDYYWVKAYVKPIMKNGEVVKITSYRKPLNEYAKNFIKQLYSKLVDYERSHSVDESVKFLQSYLDERGLTYDQFIDRLSLGKSVANAATMNIDINKYKNAHIIFKARIIDAVQSGNMDVVVDSCAQCEFGQWIHSVSNESFTMNQSWKNMIKYHELVHSRLNDYVQSAKSGSTLEFSSQILDEIDGYTKEVFDNLTDVIDNSEE